MSAPSVSILVPTLDGSADLRRLIAALDAQSYPGTVERLAIDSSSSDDSLEVLRAGGFEVEVIPRSEFGHGRTRNALARRATGEYLIYLSQDATPEGTGFIEALVAGASRDNVAGATARVLPHLGDDALTARSTVEALEGDDDEDERGGDSAVFSGLGGPARARLMRFNNVASCMARRRLLERPFPDVPFGEDATWASACLKDGMRIRHEPRAVVRHAHRYGMRSGFRRYAQDAAFHFAFHRYRVRPHLPSVLKGWAFEVRRDLFYIASSRREFSAVLRSPFLRLAQVWGQYQGGRRLTPEWEAAIQQGRVEPLISTSKAAASKPLLPTP